MFLAACSMIIMGIIVKSQIESAVNERIFGFPSKTSKNMFNFTKICLILHAYNMLLMVIQSTFYLSQDSSMGDLVT